MFGHFGLAQGPLRCDTRPCGRDMSPRSQSTAMASPTVAKSPGQAKAFAAKTLRSGRVPLEDLSTGSDSGWRELHSDRVLEDVIKDPMIMPVVVYPHTHGFFASGSG